MRGTFFSLAAFAALAGGPALADEVVPVAHFDAVEIDGGGHLILKYGPQQRVTLLQGSTQVTHFKIEQGHKLVVDICEGNCPHHYKLEVEIVSPDLQAVAIDGGGAVDTAGTFPEKHSFTAAISGGGEIDVRAIAAHNSTAAIDGGGRIAVAATANLTAAINGGGEIVYRGHPANVTRVIDGGGAVRPEE